MINVQRIFFLTIFSIYILSCGSSLKVNDFDSSAEPQAELIKIDNNIKLAVDNQVNILSPNYFEAAENARNKAVELRSDNKKQKDVLHNLAIAQANLDKANEVANVSIVMLKGAVEARKDSMLAKADTLFKKEFRQADSDFKDLTEQIEDNNTNNVEKNRGEIESTYRSIELKAIKKDKLGPAKDTIQQAIDEGAEKLTPDTLKTTNSIYSRNESIIDNQRHDTNVVNKASEEATISANRLLKMVRNAKGSSTKKPEELAKQIESNEIAALKSKNQISKGESALANSQDQLQNANAENSQLESKVWLDTEFEKARKEFNTNEAEVYKQGDRLLLRLKGLTFANNKSAIDAENFSLLAKVQKVIGDIGARQVHIEGHTDSSGGKQLNDELSTKRAESVQSYLISNNNVPAEKITAAGYGYTKPIATNKTAKGRAQNRRVDIIITAE